jgi:hypothetical protein
MTQAVASLIGDDLKALQERLSLLNLGQTLYQQVGARVILKSIKSCVPPPPALVPIPPQRLLPNLLCPLPQCKERKEIAPKAEEPATAAETEEERQVCAQTVPPKTFGRPACFLAVPRCVIAEAAPQKPSLPHGRGSIFIFPPGTPQGRDY